MTPVGTAVLIWAAGTLLFAVINIRGARDLTGRDPLTLCDPCRDHRRTWMMMASASRAPYVVAHALAAALWPVTAPWEYGTFTWDWIRWKIIPGSPSPWCDCATNTIG